jgi:hypothetical protein
MSKRAWFFCVTLSALSTIGAAQQIDTLNTFRLSGAPRDPGFAQIKVIANPGNDSVVLRWAPTTPHGWYVANRTGYVIERRTGTGAFTRLTPDTLHPWLPDQMVAAIEANRDNPYLPLALQATWGDSALLAMIPFGLDTLGAAAELAANYFSLALFAADNDPLVATALGLRFVDRTVRRGERYTYRVSLTEPRDYRVAPGEVTVDARAGIIGPPPVNLTARGLDRRIELRWEGQRQNEYSGYNVYRSQDNGRTYRKLNTRPIVLITTPGVNQVGIGAFTDSTVANYVVYRYQVRGTNPFGEQGAPAEAEAMARDMTPPVPPLVKNPEQIGTTRIRLTWEMMEIDPDLAGFVISRSAFSDSNFRPLTPRPLPKTARSYIDEAATDNEPYYLVASIDTAGNVAPSLPLYGFLIDTTPPAIPIGLRGTIDTNGVVRLQWRRNTERNILGYRVLRANALDHEFTQRTNQVWRDTVFTDTVEVNTLTRFIYYKIAAVNNRYNHSPTTAPLGLRRPDRVAPEAPVFSDVRVSDSSVVLKWASSTSEDVQSHILYRRTAGQTRWTVLATLSHSAGTFEDKDVQQNVMYEYQIEAQDSTGLRTMALLPVQARPYDTGVRPAPSALQASYDAAARRVLLSWFYIPRREEKFYYVVYRAAPNAPLVQYRSFTSARPAFTDTELLGTGSYVYAVKILTESGAESPLSEKVSVIVPR